jgi:HEAT repeat protein
MDDLLVRRAVVYGLARVNQPWSIEILENVQIEDGQWIVRNAASEALENLHQPNPYIPYPLPQLSETPWLIAFAAKLGMGVIPGKPAMELLIQALKNGSEVQRLAALEYLRLKGGEDTVVHIYHALYGNLGALREMAYNTLWHIGSTGANLPPPIQFGLG